MKNTLLLFLVLTTLRLTAQPSPPTKIIFSYYQGGNSWGVPGIYGHGENIEITPASPTSYKITKHYKFVNSTAKDSVTLVKDTSYLKTGAYPQIPKKSIDLLFKRLSNGEDNFNIAFIKPRLNKPTKKQILAVAAKMDKSYLFEDDPKEIFGRIENLDRLDSFINLNKPKPGIEIVTVDAWHGFQIFYLSSKDTIRFQGSFFQLFGQPVYKRPKDISQTWPEVVNLKINTLLSRLLPPASELKKAIAINSLTERYIEWYINKIL